LAQLESLTVKAFDFIKMRIKMKKSELVLEMEAQNQSFSADVLSKAVDVVFNEITTALTKGERVEMRGFGAFSVIGKAARIGRNPRTGEAVQIAAKNVVHFKSGKELKETVNQ
jgi:integration host factor subunit beta